MKTKTPQNFGLDLVRATEAAALAANQWSGRGSPEQADAAATEAMYEALNSLEIDGRILVMEKETTGSQLKIKRKQRIGTGRGPKMDILMDALDGKVTLSKNNMGAISVAGLAPRGKIWAPASGFYMEKIVVNNEVAEALVPECLDAPAAWTLALVARVKNKPVRELVVFMLDRPRHKNLIDEIRAAGARVMFKTDGDISGALLASSRENKVDILMGIGGVLEGALSACAVKSMGGAMLGRLAPQSADEAKAVDKAGLDVRQILTCDEIVTGNEIFFAMTGITDGSILSGVSCRGNIAETESVILRCETGTRRIIHAEQLIT